MTNKNISAEEKLLRLIKGKSKKSALETQEPRSPDRKLRPSRLSIPKINFRQIKFNKRILNYSLIILSIISSLFLVFQFTLPSQISVKKPPLKDKSEVEADISSTAKKPYAYFSKDINKRQLFGASFKLQEKSERIDNKQLKDVIKDISLVGIVSKQGKFVAIIEDKRVDKTYFLGEGDSLGELSIKQIEEGKVTLDYYGQEVDLYL